MRNQGRNRRSRNHKEADDSQLNVPRDDPQVQSYSRHQHSSHYTESHRMPSSLPTRPAYEVGRDRTVVAARSMREDDWNTSASHDRYGYDLYHHGQHDGYDSSVRRDSDAWGTTSDARYASRAGWSHSYHHGEASTSYQESSTWNPTSPPPAHYTLSPRYKGAMEPYLTPNAYLSRTPNPYDERSPQPYDDGQGYYYDQWRGRDPRPSPPEERVDYSQMDKRGNTQSWRRDQRGSKGSMQKFQSDSGWSGRRKGKDWSQSQSHWDEIPADPNLPSLEDRAWEPAESWKSSNRNEGSVKQQRQQSNKLSNKQQKPTRRGQSSGKSKKEWRSEDNLNNWTRRDNSNSKKNEKQQQSRRKHARSPSRSRSPESVRSHRSSYRSRSSSPVPKRRRRESSPALRSRSPTEGDRMGWVPPAEAHRIASRSPSPYKSPEAYRRRSASSSDRSSNRSRSPSPYERRRAVHRLPAANVSSVQSPSIVAGGGKSKKTGKQRNGHSRGSRHSGGKVPSRNQEEGADVDTLSMPPPPLPPAARSNRPSRQSTPDWREDAPSDGLPKLPSSLSFPEKPTRIVPAKHAGFKPIGQPNSALKMFFPGEDEDTEHALGNNREKNARNNFSSSAYPIVQSRGDDMRNGQKSDDNSLLHRNAPITSQVEQWDQYNTAPFDHRNVRRPYDPHHDAGNNGFTDLQNPRLVGRSETPTQWSPPPGDLTPEWGRAAYMPREPPSSYGPSFAQVQERDIEPQYPHNRASVSSDKPVTSRRTSPQPSPILHSVAKASPVSWPPVSSATTPGEPREPEPKELYVILNQVGEGTFGKVYKARNTAANIYVALKRIRMETERDGFPVTAMREIKLLQSLKHSNVVRLYEMMVSNGSVFMVFEYMDHDLTGILSQTQFRFNDAHLKSLCHQMLAGLAYLHHKGVIHRDIKGSNILLNNRGELKLADFGLARFYQKRRRTDYTNRVITLWYRPPELLFGSTVYGAEVDMWSAGCIMLELFTKKPVFQGNDEIHQLHVIFKILGTPTVERWRGLQNLPWYELIKPRETLPNRFRELFQKWMSPAALDLAERLLTYDPKFRVTAQDAMEAPYFTQENPFAERPTGLSTLDGEWHELETKQERVKKRKKTETTVP